jgi:hypothetical protein
VASLVRCALALALAVAAVSACGGTSRPTAPPRARIGFLIPAVTELDLLLMVDDSPGMLGQQEFAEALPALLDRLRALPGGVPDLHAGVITSGLPTGTNGAGGCRPAADLNLLPAPNPACGLPGIDRFLRAPAGAGEPELAAFAQKLGCLARVGQGGCAHEHQLASVISIFPPGMVSPSARLLRERAHLVILFFTDEDDCSAPPDTTLFLADLPETGNGVRCALAGHVCGGLPPPAAEFKSPMGLCAAAEGGPLIPLGELTSRLLALRRDEQSFTVAGIFAVPAAHPEVPYEIRRDPQGRLEYASHCQSQLGEAKLGLRLQAFMDQLPAVAITEDICVDDLRPTMARIGRAITKRLTSTCVPGASSTCRVEAARQPLPACQEAGARPCWRTEPDRLCARGHRVVIDGAEALPAGTAVEGTCEPAS